MLRLLYSHNNNSFKSVRKVYSSAIKSNLQFRTPLFLFQPYYQILSFLLPCSSINLLPYVRQRGEERGRETSMVESKQAIILIIISIPQCYIQPSHPSHSLHRLAYLIPQSSATTDLMHDCNSMHTD